MSGKSFGEGWLESQVKKIQRLRDVTEVRKG